MRDTSQKLKIMRIKQIFEEYSDADHPITVEQIIELLYSQYGITAEQKSIYRDINELINSKVLDIEHTGKSKFYYLL